MTNNLRLLKVATVVGTRPEIIRLSRTLSELEKFCEHTLIHTGQNYDYELNQIFFDDLELRKPDFFLETTGQSKSTAQTIGNIISKTDEVLAQIKPDAVLLLGDTNSCLSALSAKRRKIPVFHMEAGNRCFDLRVPEEINRRIVDAIADVNITYSSIAREYLLKEGHAPDSIIKVGSPMREVLMHFLPKIQSSSILKKLKLKANGFILISFHREENVDNQENMKKFYRLIIKLLRYYQLPIVISTHPRTRLRLEDNGFQFPEQVSLLKPLGFFDYVNLQINSFVTLSDSGTISEESAILDFPALNLREAHERPEAMEEASVMMVGLNSERIIQAINVVKADAFESDLEQMMPMDYRPRNVSKKIVKIIHSYTDYVNQRTWRQ